MNWNSLNKIILSSNNIILSTHVNPDGDGIGSELGMYYYLKDIGKKCTIINVSKTPIFLDFIDPEDIIEVWDDSIHLDFMKNVDLAIIFDIGDYKRLESIYKNIEKNQIYSVSIDHHPYDADFFDLALVDTNYPATGHMVWDFLQYNKCKNLNTIQATALYAALITDTGSFRYNSTNPACHLMASHLLECGVNPYDVYESIYERRSKQQLSLLSKSIDKLNFYFNDIVCGSIITKKMQEESGANSSHVEGFTDFFRSVNKVQIAFCIIEQEKNIRINFRSRGKYVINDVAKKFGGGGHKLAAGATITGKSSTKIKDEILKYLKRKI